MLDIEIHMRDIGDIAFRRIAGKRLPVVKKWPHSCSAISREALLSHTPCSISAGRASPRR